MDLGDCLSPVFALHIGRDHPAFERARTIESGGGDDVLELVGTHLREQVTHSARLKLEDSFCFAALQEGESFLVVEWQVFGDDVDAAVSFHVLDRAVENGEVAEAEEVHFQQTGLLDFSPLREHVLLAGNLLQGHVLDQRSVGDHDPRGVGSRALGQPFEGHREIEDLFDLGVFVVLSLEVGALFEGVLELDVQFFGNHLRDDISPFEVDAKCAADIAHRSLGLQGAEGTDLGDVGVAVLLLHVLDDQFAAFLAEVDVDIGRFGSIGVEEAFEQQVVLDRADIRQTKHVGHDGATG